MNNMHDDGPEVFETRWAMSYLRGPLTRTQIKTLMDPIRQDQEQQQQQLWPLHRLLFLLLLAERPGSDSRKPVLPPEITQYYIPVRSSAERGGKVCRIIQCCSGPRKFITAVRRQSTSRNS